MNLDPAYFLPIRIFHDFATRLETLNIQYMLTGSMAMFQYSNYRMTADVDIVMELKSQHGRILIDNLEPDYTVPHKSMIRAIASESMFNVIHQETAFKIDCVLRKSTPFQITAFGRRQVVDFHGKRVPVITLEDLIISKLLWAADSKSDKQMADIKNLMRNQFDRDYIENWTNKLDVTQTYENCRSEIGI